MPFVGRDSVIVPGDQTISHESLERANHDVAEEVVARLELALQTK